MRISLVLAVLAGCATTAVRPTPTEAELKDLSHALCDALDRADAAELHRAAGPAFVQFFLARTYDRAFVEKGLTARAERKEPPHTRTWTDERFARGPGVGTFMGEATVRYPPTSDMPGGELTRWYTLVWVHDGADWKLEHLQIQSGGIDAEREAWNDTYRGSAGFKHGPNQLLVDSVKGHKPGTALDLATGQGRNALFLAKEGWKVTGVDLSDEGLRQTSKSAVEQQLTVETVQADLDHWDLGKDRWDLVTLIYAGGDPGMIERIKPSVRSGGLVVIEYFHGDATQGTGIGGFKTGQPGAAFGDGWTVLRDEVVEDTSDWGLRKTKLVRFVAQKK